MQRARIAYSYTYHHTVLHNHGLVIIIVGPLCGVLHNHFITLIAPLPGVDLSDAGRDHGAQLSCIHPRARSDLFQERPSNQHHGRQ